MPSPGTGTGMNAGSSRGGAPSGVVMIANQKIIRFIFLLLLALLTTGAFARDGVPKRKDCRRGMDFETCVQKCLEFGTRSRMNAQLGCNELCVRKGCAGVPATPGRHHR